MNKKSFVLSGGGCRGFAHLGVVKALQEFGISPGEISGTSAGAMAGVFLADGYTPDEIKEMLVSQIGFSMFPLNIFKPGLISMRNIEEFLRKNLRHSKFEELQMPFYVTATNFIDGTQKIFKHGDLISPIIAAASIPAIFPQVLIDDIPYVDGGLANNLPIEPFISKKNEIVAVHVNPIKPFNPKEGFMDIIDRAVHLSFREIVNRSSGGCYLFIEPTDLNKFGMFDIHKVEEIFDIGYTFTRELLKLAPIHNG